MKFYLVGGSCRDILMGIHPKDYDFVVVGASPEDFSEWECVGKDFPVFLEPSHGWEVALARTERKNGTGYNGFTTETKGVTLEEDLARRDLTVNSIAIEVDWKTTVLLGEPVTVGSWIDPFNGQQDIKDKILSPTTDFFKEDPVRMLRAGRFLARYPDFSSSESLIEQCNDLEKSGELLSLVPDRVWAETQKALQEKVPSRYFEFISQWEWPFVEFLNDMKTTVEDNLYHQEENVFVHTMMVLDHASENWNCPKINFSCLLHDLAKPLCYKERGNGHGHDSEGVPLIKEFCEKWKVPNSYRDMALITCEQHQKIHSTLGRSGQNWSRPKSLFKMFEQSGALSHPDRFRSVLKACESDHKGRIGLSAHLDYLQRPYLKNCLQAVIEVDTKPISSQMLESGKEGKSIGEAIRVARIDAIRLVQKKWKEKLL